MFLKILIAIKSSKKKVIIIKVIDNTKNMIKLEINIFFSFFGCLLIKVATALGNDKFDNEINKTIKGLTKEKIPIASTPSSRFMMILDSNEMNFALIPRNKILTKYKV